VALAAALHVGALALLPGLPEPEQRPSVLEVARGETVGGKAIPLDIFFGPPIMDGDAGVTFRQPPTRVLWAQRPGFFPASCREAVEETSQVFSGSVRLQVNTGLAEVGDA